MGSFACMLLSLLLSLLLQGFQRQRLSLFKWCTVLKLRFGSVYTRPAHTPKELEPKDYLQETRSIEAQRDWSKRTDLYIFYLLLLWSTERDREWREKLMSSLKVRALIQHFRGDADPVPLEVTWLPACCCYSNTTWIWIWGKGKKKKVKKCSRWGNINRSAQNWTRFGNEDVKVQK